jgi:hypothetical protein
MSESEARIISILGDPGPLRALRTRHFLGPPAGLPELEGEQTLLPFAKILVIEGEPDGASLYRYTKDGEPAGDTWHTDVEEALLQAEFEFGDLLGPWESVPDATVDVVQYAQARLGNDRS